MKQHNKIIIIGLMFTTICIVYILRLASLQWFPNMLTRTVQGKIAYDRNWRYGAIEQRQGHLLIDDSRAIYLDDKGHYLHKVKTYKLLLVPHLLDEMMKDKIGEQLAQILLVSASTIVRQFEEAKRPTWLSDTENKYISLSDEQVFQIKEKSWIGVYVIETLEEPLDLPFIHSIGFTAQNPEIITKLYKHKVNHIYNWDINSKIGVIGLERSLDRYLHGVENKKIVWYEDAQGNVITGLGVNIVGQHNNYPLKVQTTIDTTLQETIEQMAIQHYANQMAIVVLDVNTNDVKAIVSKPMLFPRKLDEGMLKNNATTSHRPGSIYKIVTLAAALEFNVIKENESFYCNGEYGKYGLSCWKHGGHGKQTLKEAFANSCNVAFAIISERLTAKQLTDVAHTLGVVDAVSWHADHKKAALTLSVEEEKGRFFIDSTINDRGEIAQASIGQRDALINPLQAASLVAMIARGGASLEARVATSIQFANGQILKKFETHVNDTSRFKLKKNTIERLQSYLEEVVNSGTGSSLQRASVSIAGKSGTAQLGHTDSNRNNYWFIGYFPVEKPKYAMAVVILNTKSNDNPATKLFGEIVDSIYNK